MRFHLLAALPFFLVATGASAATVQSRAVPPDVQVAQDPAVATAARIATVTTRPAAPGPRVLAAPLRAVQGLRVSAALPPEAASSESPVAAAVPAVQPPHVVKPVETVQRPPAARPAPRAARSDLDGDVRCVAQAVFHEARGESVQGQRAVADVVMNRARSGRWGGSACAVVNAPSQFSNRWSWRAPQIGVEQWDRAVSIARAAVSGAVGVSSRLMNFRAARLGGGGLRALRIGNHVFW